MRFSNLLNVPFAVMFGVIFNFSFKLWAQPTYHVTWAVSLENFPLWGILVFYFFISWFGHNLLLGRIQSSVSISFLWAFSAWYLGITILMANSLGFPKYLWVSSYIVVIGIYDFFASRSTFYQAIIPSSFVWMLLTGFVVLLGFLLLVPTLLFYIGGVIKPENYLNNRALVVVSLFIADRIVRIYSLAARGSI
jgi:hypothetical protein